MAPHYSIVIHPPENIICEVNTLKQQLYDAIGWYHSCHSLAHITVNLFKGYENTLQLWENYTAAFAAQQTITEVYFDHVMNFSNGAFVVVPNESSYKKLNLLMKNYLHHIPASAYGKSLKPHISIARKLNAEQAAIAKELIADVSLQFEVDNLTLRKFNAELGQYELHKQYAFKI